MDVSYAGPRLAGLLPAHGQQIRAEIAINDTGVGAENLTSIRDGTVYFGSMQKGNIYRALPGAAQAEVWIQASATGLTRVLGLLADEKSNTLWVCANPGGGRGAPTTGQMALRSFDLKTGAATGTYPIDGGGTLNDLAIAADGSIYACETYGGRIVRLKPGAKAVEAWLTNADLLRGIDGLSFLADGALYVNNFFSGALFRIPVNTDGTAGSPVRIETSIPFTRPDGLRTSSSNALLQAEGQGRATEIRIEGNRGQVRVLRDGFASAAGITQVGSTAFVLVEGMKAVAVPIPAGPASVPAR